MIAERIARGLEKPHRIAGGWQACCPAHEDRDPSLSISEKDGRVLVHCHAGCTQADVVAALKNLGLWPESEPKPGQKPKLGPIIAEYLYRDEQGEVLYRVTRHCPKNFRQWRPDGRGGWMPGLGNTRRVLYRLREVIEAAIIFIVEGERDVEVLRSMGFCATCCSGGSNASAWRPEYNPVFKGRTVVVIPDADAPGRAHGKRIVAGVKPYASQVIVIDLERDAKDISEWLERGHSEVELIGLIDAAWKPEVSSHGA